MHFIVVGCLFFWPLIGLDPLPGRGRPGQALVMLISTPFRRARLTIMQMTTPIGGNYYPICTSPGRTDVGSARGRRHPLAGGGW